MSIVALIDYEISLVSVEDNAGYVNNPALRQAVRDHLRFNQEDNCWKYHGKDFEPVYDPLITDMDKAITYTINYLMQFDDDGWNWLKQEAGIF